MKKIIKIIILSLISLSLVAAANQEPSSEQSSKQKLHNISSETFVSELSLIGEVTAKKQIYMACMTS